MKLYRYISFESFVDLVQSSTLCFVFPPEAWEDTFEGYAYHAMKTSDGRKKIISILESDKPESIADVLLSEDVLKIARFQSWSKAGDEIAMWSIYSHLSKSLMISTSSEKLLSLSYENSNVTCFEVKYIDSYSLEAELEAIGLNQFHIKNLFRSKRSAFAHEKEVRASVLCNQIEDAKIPIRVKVPNVQDFIESVLVHPSAPSWYVGIVQEYCRINRIKFLGQSKLYKFEV